MAVASPDGGSRPTSMTILIHFTNPRTSITYSNMAEVPVHPAYQERVCCIGTCARVP